MNKKIFVYDPTASDKLSAVRGVGRYLQILKENFPEWTYINNETMKQLNNDCIFINPYFNFLQPPLTLKRIAQRQIAVIHDLIPLKYPSYFPAGFKGNINIFLNKLALKNYDIIITDSEASKNDIVNILKIKSERLKVVYPCLPNIFLNPKSKTKNYELQTNPYCLYVGDATWNKNLVNLARAIKIANVTCVFVGKVFDKSNLKSKIQMSNQIQNPKMRNNETMEQCNNNLILKNPWNRELKQFLKETHNDKRFIFAGFVPDSELIKLYQQTAFNILPSCDEGFGFSFLEAAQFSCPSVLSDIPVLKEISDENALFADPKNPHDLADKIGEIYFNKDLRNEVGAKAKKRVGYFSREKFRTEFLSII